MWKKLSPTGRALFFLILGAITMAGLLVLIFATEQDRGLRFEKSIGCTPTVDLSRLPYFTVLSPEGKEWEDAALLAVHEWEKVDPRLIVLGGVASDLDGDRAGIVLIHVMPMAFIQDECPGTEEGHGCTRLTIGDDCKIRLAVTFVPSETDPSLRQRVLEHEIGHMFNFAHDDMNSSVMYPKALRTEYSITEKDQAIAKGFFKHADQ